MYNNVAKKWAANGLLSKYFKTKMMKYMMFGIKQMNIFFSEVN